MSIEATLAIKPYHRGTLSCRLLASGWRRQQKALPGLGGFSLRGTLLSALRRLRELRRRCLAPLALLESLAHRGRRHVLVLFIARPVLLQAEDAKRHHAVSDADCDFWYLEAVAALGADRSIA